jgi:hypothetical protein
MSRHVSPHLWADYGRGKMRPRTMLRMQSHASNCSLCRHQRDLVCGSMEEFAHIAHTASPELRWESIRTQIHWKVAAQARDLPSREPRLFGKRLWVPITATALAATTLGLWQWQSHHDGPPLQASSDIRKIAPTEEAAKAAAALTGVVTKLSGGAVALNGQRIGDESPSSGNRTSLFERPIVAGDVIATADAELHVQFGPQSGFSLQPGTTATLRRFDSQVVELVVDGVVDVEVTARQPGQRFAVVAGTRLVEVRGTQFRVARHGEELSVLCQHGKVVVSDGVRNSNVTAGQVIAVPPDAIGSAGQWPSPSAMTTSEANMMAAAAPYKIASAADVSDGGIIAISAVAGRMVRVDGVEVGRNLSATASLLLRSTAGRHRIEAADDTGRFRHAKWIDVPVSGSNASPGTHIVNTLVIEDPDNAEKRSKKQIRKSELNRLVNRAAMATCVRSIAKQGLGAGYVSLEISIDGAGNIATANVADSDLSSSMSNCVRDLVATMKLPVGPSASFIVRFDVND